MTKAELTERILDHIVDPYNDSPDDYADLEPLTLEEATEYLAQCRHDDDLAELEGDERMPDEVTPELYREVFNCWLRKRQRDLKADRLADWITDNEAVYLYTAYRYELLKQKGTNKIDLCPVQWISDESIDWTFGCDTASLLAIGMNSANTFSFADMYFWYDEENDQLHSTNYPYKDGVIDATDVAEYLIDNMTPEIRSEILSQMADDDVRYIFGKTEEEVTTHE